MLDLRLCFKLIGFRAGPLRHKAKEVENLSISAGLESLGHLSGLQSKFIVLRGMSKNERKFRVFIFGPVFGLLKLKADQLCLRITNVDKHTQSFVGELAVYLFGLEAQFGLLFLEAGKAPPSLLHAASGITKVFFMMAHLQVPPLSLPRESNSKVVKECALHVQGHIKILILFVFFECGLAP